MARDTQTEIIRSSWEDILQRITSPAKEKVNRQTSYICPLCGHGKSGDGLTVNPKSPDGNSLKCFGCGFTGDIIDLIGRLENISYYPEKLKRAGELAGVDVSAINTSKGSKTASRNEQSYNRNEQAAGTDMDTHTNTYTPTHTHNEAETLLPYFRECNSRIKETDYLTRRGISPEIANRFMLGYDPHFTQYTKGAVWEALIIPTGYGSYVARNTDPAADAKNRYRKYGNSTPLNLGALKTAKKPIFIVEGEIDCLSIVEAGGEAIGLGSTANYRQLVDAIKRQKPAQPIVLALDNDEAGQNTAEAIAKELDKLGETYYRMNPAGDFKDSNEALVANPEAFAKAVAEAERLEVEAFEAEKEAYLATRTDKHIKAFVGDIVGRANTPAQSTGFYKLDQTLDGGLYPGLYVLGAISSLGKTTLALQVADNIARQARDVLIFSLEMSRYELMAKSISRHTFEEVEEYGGGNRNLAKTTLGITTGSRYQRYSPEEKDLIKTAMSVYSEYSPYLYINEGMGNINVDMVRETVEKHIRFTESKRPPVILIDYLQLLQPVNERATDKQNVDRNVMELKRISRDFGTTVIAISSVNRSNYMTPIDFESFKESGGIEFSSDVVLGLQLACLEEELFTKDGKIADKRARIKTAKAESPRQIQLIVLKNRNGETGGRVDFDYYQPFNYFIEH